MTEENLKTESLRVNAILERNKNGVIDHARIFSTNVCKEAYHVLGKPPDNSVAAGLGAGIFTAFLGTLINHVFFDRHFNRLSSAEIPVSFKKHFFKSKKIAWDTIDSFGLNKYSPEFRSSSSKTEWMYFGVHNTGERHLDLLLRLPSNTQRDLKPQLFLFSYESSLTYLDKPLEVPQNGGILPITPARKALSQRFVEARNRFYQQAPDSLMPYEFHSQLASVFNFEPSKVSETAMQRLLVIEAAASPDELIEWLEGWKQEYIK